MHVLCTWDETVLENKEIRPYLIASINHEDIMLSEINQSENKYFMIQLNEVSKIIKHIEVDSIKVVARSCRNKKYDSLFSLKNYDLFI